MPRHSGAQRKLASSEAIAPGASALFVGSAIICGGTFEELQATMTAK
jgi:hypothetical protein